MGRGLRGWALAVNPIRPRPARVLALATDAFGGRGGIAKFNRDLLTATCSSRRCAEVVAIPRLMQFAPEPIPSKLRYVTQGLDSKLNYVLCVLRTVLEDRSFNVIYCCHINLIALAWIAKRLTRAQLVLVVHGIDAWQPTKSWMTNRLVRAADRIVAVSDLTRRRFVSWSKVDAGATMILPNCVDLSRFSPAEKNAELLERYGLAGRTVLMTLGRLVSAERYKGFDEVLEAMPGLATQLPKVGYLIVGDGNDRPRLERKAQDLGIRDRVVFAGYVDEEEKRAHYNLADVFVMPSRGEGFGIVFLEAMACGVPVIASLVDGGREALRDGELGQLVEPGQPDELRRAIREALDRPRGVPKGLEYFTFESFEARLHHLLEELCARHSIAGTSGPARGPALSPEWRAGS